MLLLLSLLLPAQVPAPDTAVVCPVEFRQALEPWIAHRERQGHVIEVLAPREKPQEVQADLKRVAERGKLRYVLLVGDDLDPRAEPNVRSRQIPAPLVQATVNVRWGSEPAIASDNWYADLDGDAAPDLAIGRLPVDSAEELSALVRKILAYEAAQDYGAWRSRLNFIAGVGNFGVVADAVLEAATKHLISSGVPAAYTTSMTYGSWRSPYCPDPREFHQTAVARMNEGCLFWVYIGHGHRWFLDRVRVPGGEHHILDVRDMAKLNCQNGAPIAFFLACYTAAFDGPHDCLAEEMMRADGGPIAVIGGSRVTMPYGLASFGSELFVQYFDRRQPTLGDMLLEAKRSLVQSDSRSPFRVTLDSVGAALSPTDLAEERTEHLHLLNLLGDPLLALRYPQPVEIETPKYDIAAGQLEVTGTCDIDGPCELELVVRRDRLTFRPPVRPNYARTEGELADYQNIYRRANDSRLTTVQTTVQDGRFTATLPLPADAQGACHVRAFVKGREDFAIGSRDVELEGEATKRR